MRTTLALLALAFMIVPALAQERIPSNEEALGVPDVIPKDWCIEVHWTEKSRPFHEGEKIRLRYPPLDDRLTSALSRLRSDGQAVLKRCSASKT